MLVGIGASPRVASCSPKFVSHVIVYKSSCGMTIVRPAVVALLGNCPQAVDWEQTLKSECDAIIKFYLY